MQYEWDANCCTIADYTVQLDISKTLWKEWIKSLSDQTFREYLQEQIESQLKEKDPAYDGDDYKKEDVQIASISFAYDNRELL